MTLSIAIIGSGPAGCYLAEALARAGPAGLAIDVIDRLPTPYGLIRAGVAPDHASVKAVSRRFEATLAQPGVRLLGGVELDRHVTLDELRGLYDAVALATGAPLDRRLGVPGETLPGVWGSGAFVAWYNGHPDFQARAPDLSHPRALVVGAGNVALDVARLLARTPREFDGSDLPAHATAALAASGVREILIIARRGAEHAAFSPKELGEMGELARARPVLDPAQAPDPALDAGLEPGRRKVMAILRSFAATPVDDRPVTITFAFSTRPVRFEGDGRLDAAWLEGPDGTQRRFACGLAITAIGYRSAPLAGAPFDAAAGRFVNEGGRIADGLWATGWARRGPSGTIGTNRTDAIEVAARILAETTSSARPGPAGLDALLASRGVVPATLADWQRLDAIEQAAAPPGRLREKLVTHEALAEALASPAAPLASRAAAGL
jgi:NADPH-dependent glutamate synthase beta subunit-like oxidoreductase